MNLGLQGGGSEERGGAELRAVSDHQRLGPKVDSSPAKLQ